MYMCPVHVHNIQSLMSSCTLQALLVRLTMLGVPRMPAPKRLVNPEEEEEEEEPEADTDQFLQQLSSERNKQCSLSVAHTCTCTLYMYVHA